jgi:cobalt-zinc-cadmium efflux system membrane fusion protein
VFVETSPWTFERRVVEVGEQAGDKIALVKGVDEGARVVVANAVLLP